MTGASEPTPPKITARACLPLKVKPISPEDLVFRQAAVLMGPEVNPLPSPVGHTDRAELLTKILSRLESLENKIDVLLSMSTADQVRMAREEGVFVEIGTHGLTYLWNDPIPRGKLFEFEITLSLIPPIQIGFVAEVNSCKRASEVVSEDPLSSSNKYLIEAEIKTISAEDREAIYRFLASAQRRARRNATQDSGGIP